MLISKNLKFGKKQLNIVTESTATMTVDSVNHDKYSKNVNA